MLPVEDQENGTGQFHFSYRNSLDSMNREDYEICELAGA
jgi:hypothetical protein